MISGSIWIFKHTLDICVSHKHEYETEIFSEKKTFNLLLQRSVSTTCFAHMLYHISLICVSLCCCAAPNITSFKNMELCSIADQER